MKVSFGSKKFQETISKPRACIKHYGLSMQKIIHRRLNEFLAAPNLETMRGVGDCHELQGDLRGCFAIDLQGPKRMLFKPAIDLDMCIENNVIIWGRIDSIEIVSITDYH